MTEQEFDKRIIKLLEVDHPSPLNSSTEDVLVQMKKEVQAKSKSEWDKDVAKEVMRQFEWVINSSKQN